MAEARVSSHIRRHATALADQLRAWLSSSRIQASSGAFCAWRDAATDSLAYEYPEITGYALTWLTAHDPPRDREREAGAAAAAWLVRRLEAGDVSARESWDAGTPYNFDLGMIATGLMRFGGVTGEAAYSEAGRGLAVRLAQEVDRERGMAPLPAGASSNRGGAWSTVGRVHLTKCAQALLLAEQRSAAEALAHTAIDNQRPDGSFVTEPGAEEVMLHPHFYAVEGLWAWAAATGDEQALASARRATEWAWGHQLSSGGFPRWVRNGDRGDEQLDATAQAVRAAVLLDVDAEGLDAAVGRLIGCAKSDGSGRAAVIYSPASSAEHLNAWVTMFSAQALAAAAEGPRAISWNTLV